MLQVANEAIGPGIGNRNANAVTSGADGRRDIHLKWRVPQHAQILPIYPDLSQTMKRSHMQNHPRGGGASIALDIPPPP